MRTRSGGPRVGGKLDAGGAQLVGPALQVALLGLGEVEEDLRALGILLGLRESPVELDAVDLALVVLAVALEVVFRASACGAGTSGRVSVLTGTG